MKLDKFIKWLYKIREHANEGEEHEILLCMDDETRFWISQQVADTKDTDDITPLFSKGKDVDIELELEQIYTTWQFLSNIKGL